MGWTYTHREAGQCTDRQWFEKQYGLHPDGGSRILDCATVAMKTVYIAYRTDDNKVVGDIILTNWRRDGDWYNYGWKDMTETMGPCEAECPERILKLLSPLEEVATPRTDGEEGGYEWAKRWRERCWALINGKKLIKVGSVVVFTQPVRFTNGEEIKVMLVDSTNPMRLSKLGGWGAYRMQKKSILANMAMVYPSKADYLASLKPPVKRVCEHCGTENDFYSDGPFFQGCERCGFRLRMKDEPVAA